MRRLLIALGLLSIVALPGAAMAAFPMIRDACATTEGANATTHPICNPISSAAGDRVIVVIGIDGTPTLTPPSSTYCVGDAWTTIQAGTADGDNQTTSAIYSCELDAVMSGTENISSGVASEEASIVVIVIVTGTSTGVPIATTPVSNAAASTCTATSIDPPTLTSGFGAVDTMWFVTASSDGGVIIRPAAATPDMTWTNRIIGSGTAASAASGVGVMWKLQNTATLNPGTDVIVLGSNDNCITNTMALEGATPAAPGGSGGPPFLIGG